MNLQIPSRSSFVLRNSSLAFAAALLALLAIAWGQTVHVYIPGSLSARRVGDTVNVPILISGQTGLNIISADITICFRGVSGTLPFTPGGAGQDSSLAARLESGRLRAG